MTSNLIIHIPHASTTIPPDIRKYILLDDKELKQEMLLMTDLYTDKVPISRANATTVKATVSRLVVDVERFRDDEREEMAKVGMGAVYTKTHDGRPLRRLAPEQREELLKRYYDPHHKKLMQVVGEALRNFDRCLIVDVHSFSSVPLHHEPDQAPGRPDICLGTDAFHTPDLLFKHARRFFEKQGLNVKENTPFKGTMVPAVFFRKNALVHSIMIEINRRLLIEDLGSAMKRKDDHILSGVADWIGEASDGLALTSKSN